MHHHVQLKKKIISHDKMNKTQPKETKQASEPDSDMAEILELSDQ